MVEFKNVTDPNFMGKENGAVLLAYCRGKVSEGTDFPDDMARAVIIVGIPYPGAKDIRVDLKKKYMDNKFKAHYKSKNRLKLLDGK